MDYAHSILDLVGNTPLVELTRVTRELGPAERRPLILAKLEAMNPGGSVKDRIGLPMIEAAERAGLLKPGGTIIEPTSGNTGHGLAIVDGPLIGSSIVTFAMTFIILVLKIRHG